MPSIVVADHGDLRFFLPSSSSTRYPRYDSSRRALFFVSLSWSVSSGIGKGASHDARPALPPFGGPSAPAHVFGAALGNEPVGTSCADPSAYPGRWAHRGRGSSLRCRSRGPVQAVMIMLLSVLALPSLGDIVAPLPRQPGTARSWARRRPGR